MTNAPQIEDPPGFTVRVELQKAAYANGYRLERGTEAGWIAWGSTTAHGLIRLAGESASGSWLLALDHPGVIAELGMPQDNLPGPGLARYRFATLSELYAALSNVYRLAVSLPDAPLAVFEQATNNLPRSTEAERLVVQRIGQGIFRDALMAYWGGRCPVTGINHPRLLRASHIIPWAECETDAERLDVYNGLLLAAHVDAAFDAHLLSFDEAGRVIYAPELGEDDRHRLRLDAGARITGLTARHQDRLARHRARLEG